MQMSLLLICLLFLTGIFGYKINGENSSGSSRAIQIANPMNHTFLYELSDVKKLLEADDIKDRHVVIVSVAGAFRKGKSFLLNFYLRFLYAQYKKHNVSDWIGENYNSKLDGFSWRGGRKPDTTGILMWSDIFTHDYENGDKIAIILLDTQGTFDSRSSLLDCTTIFALSTLLSSVQCYNVMHNIQEDDLQNLHLFIEYGRLAHQQSNEKPFQNLLFIVRDWQNRLELDYGWPGEDMLAEVLEENDYQTDDMRQLRKQIRSSFAKISAFLMPHPGSIVATGQFNGNMQDIDSDFKKYLKILVPSILAPENLIVKEINGEKVRARDWLQYLQQYTKIFDGKTLPEPKTVLQATAEVNNMILYNLSLHKYLDLMEKLFKNVKTCYNHTEFIKLHMEAKQTLIEQFLSKPKIGSVELVTSFQHKLDFEINTKFQDFQERNEKICNETAEMLYTKLINSYTNSMQNSLINHVYLNQEKLSQNHLRIKQQVIEQFESTSKYDANDISVFYQHKLDTDIEAKFQAFNYQNEKKRREYNEELNRINEEKMKRIRAEAEYQNRRRAQAEENQSNQSAKMGGGTLGGAAIGGMIGGPVGALIGGGVGLLAGWFAG